MILCGRNHVSPIVRRETALSRRARFVRPSARKKGVHGGNMVSPMQNRPDWVRIPVAGIQRLIEQAAATN